MKKLQKKRNWFDELVQKSRVTKLTTEESKRLYDEVWARIDYKRYLRNLPEPKYSYCNAYGAYFPTKE